MTFILKERLHFLPCVTAQIVITQRESHSRIFSPAGASLQDALTFGCRVAGWKCGRHGYDSIGEKFGAKT